MRGWKKIFHVNGNKKKAGIVIFMSDKGNFKTKTVKNDKEALYKDEGINIRTRYNIYKYVYT